MVKPTPEASPHYRGPLVSEAQPKSKGPGKGRRRIMTGVGFFDSPVEPQSAPESQAQVQVETVPVRESVIPRKLLFTRGANLYAFIRDSETGEIVIPQTQEQEEDLFSEQLAFDTTLNVNRDEGLEIGKNRTTVIKKVGTSRYGAFTVVDVEKKDKDGNVFTEKKLVDLRTRALKRDNAALRFKRVNQ